MGQQRVTANGETLELDEDTTVEELKQQVGAGTDDIATYKDADGNWVSLSDRDQIRHVPADTTVAFQPPARFGR